LIFLSFVLIYLAPNGKALERPNAIYTKDTSYYRLFVGENPDHTIQYLLLDTSVQGGILLNSSESAYPYTYLLQAVFAAKPETQKVLFLGTGAGVAQKAFLKINSQIRIDSVDIDPEVIRAAKEYFGLPEDDRLRLHVGDARFFLRNSGGQYDAIVLDVFTSDVSVPFHVVTSEMMAEVRKHLTEDGVFASNIVGSVEGDYSLLFASFIKTCSAHFSCIHILPEKDDPHDLQNIIVLASNSGDCMPKEELREALLSLPQNTVVDWREYNRSMLAGEIDLKDAVFMTDDYVPAEFINMKASEKIFKKP
jgi:spermidine synthase